MAKYSLIQTSVFTDDNYPFSGNQLATFTDFKANKTLTSDQMQGIAREMNFSETTFIFPSKLDNCSAKVKIYTPYNELPFAGHPTLGTTFVLKNQGIIPSGVNKTHLELGIGPIKVELKSDDTIAMTQKEPKFKGEFSDLNIIAEILSLKKKDFNDKFLPQFVFTGSTCLIIPLNRLEAVQKANVNVKLLMDNIKDFPIMIFSTETIHKENHVHARFFAPGLGVFEDPATGSAVGPLGAYIAYHDIIEGHKISIEQGYEINRPSKLLVEVKYENEKISGIEVSGKVKKIAEGTFFL
ncbi:MAG: PhzF family phenazine biosynthesis protein [Candidatus Hodarchaeales archaeon]|jgi:trans-2,3-dihydro-3-hydroxyanthranilate isomerase